jgi:starch synthase (maltosyl-transferring)
LYENAPERPGSEEYLDSEKYQLRPRDWSTPDETLAPYLTMLNTFRRAHPALQDLRSLRFHGSEAAGVTAFSKRVGEDIILVACLLDPQECESTIWWDMPALGLAWDERFLAHDLLSDRTWTWGRQSYVKLSPDTQVAHIVHVRKG